MVRAAAAAHGGPGVYRVTGFVFHAPLILPPTGTRRGGLVLIQEIFGVTDHIKECCDSYAAEGYEVLGPALYDREAPGFAVSYSPEDPTDELKLAGEG